MDAANVQSADDELYATVSTGCTFGERLTGCLLKILVYHLIFPSSYQHGYQPNVYPAANTTPVEPAANQNEANAARPNQRAAGAGNQAIVMNAQGGAVVDDEEDAEGGNRDWLDWMYTVSRFMVLLSIVYFYSSFSRFIMVLSLSVIVYMWVFLVFSR